MENILRLDGTSNGVGIIKNNDRVKNQDCKCIIYNYEATTITTIVNQVFRKGNG
jgi:hypothetical protein